MRHALEQGQLDEASRVLEHWLGNRPQAAEAYYLKARLARARNDLPTAQQGLARARALGYPVGQGTPQAHDIGRRSPSEYLGPAGASHGR
ncbi:MAG: hypothetical protein WA746_29595 [Isosphaeraceae bacterium]